MKYRVTRTNGRWPRHDSHVYAYTDALYTQHRPQHRGRITVIIARYSSSHANTKLPSFRSARLLKIHSRIRGASLQNEPIFISAYAQITFDPDCLSFTFALHKDSRSPWKPNRSLEKEYSSLEHFWSCQIPHFSVERNIIIINIISMGLFKQRVSSTNILKVESFEKKELLIFMLKYFIK